MSMICAKIGLVQDVKEEIPGLRYFPKYIDSDEQNQLIKIVEQQSWSIDSSENIRRIQQYGYKLDYQKGYLVASTHLGALPSWANKLAKRFLNDGMVSTVLDQVTVNEYQPGQGVRSHIDCVTCFGNTIVLLSLGGSCVMNFTHSSSNEQASVLLAPGSLLILKGASRYGWKHSITAQDKDRYQGEEIVRKRRISLTFREILFPHK